MPAIGIAVIAPTMPAMQENFRSVPDVAKLVPLVVGAPALAMALFSPVIGALMDRFGRRHFLLSGLALFAVAGLAPLVLGSLPAIIVSRLVVGLATATIVNTCTVLIGDNYTGRRRAQYLALQTVCNTVAAVVFFGVGGALGEYSWRAPYVVFAIGVLLLPVMTLVQPPRHAAAVRAAAAEQTGPPPRWRALVPTYLLTVVGAVMFNVPVFETSALMEQTGVTSAQLIGIVSALCGLSTVVGAVAVRETIDAPPRRLLAIGFTLNALGYAVIAACSLLDGVVVGVIVIVGLMLCGFGGGVLLPALLVWSTRKLTYERRGRGTGLWHAAFFLGQFLTPVVVTAVSEPVGGLFVTMGIAAVACLVTALAVGILRPRGRAHDQPEMTPPEALSRHGDARSVASRQPDLWGADSWSRAATVSRPGTSGRPPA